MGNAMSLAVAVAVPLGGGFVIGISMRDDVNGWYKTVKKPSWNPPSWLFGPVWSVLYAAMGWASWRVWQAGGGPVPLGLYAAQLALNFAWSPLFFKAHNLKAASIDITVLLGLVAATIYNFSKVDAVAAAALVPYLGWASFATALTYNIWLNNDPEGLRAKAAARDAAEAAAAAASKATAAAATPFLAQGGERQGSAVPDEAAAATAARTAGKED